MTLSRRPSRRQQEHSNAFVEQAAAEETAQLHCQIPASLHRRLRILAVTEGASMKDLVVSAIEELLASRS